MACSEIDWTQPLQFADGSPAYLHAEISPSGRCLFADGETTYADMFAEMYDSGVRYLVHASPDGDRLHAYAYDALGYPQTCYESRFPDGPCQVENAPPVDNSAMEALPGWGSWS